MDGVLIGRIILYLIQAVACLAWSVRLKMRGVPREQIVPVMLLAPLSDVACVLGHHLLERMIDILWFGLCMWLLWSGGGGPPRRRRRVTPKAEDAPVREILPRVLRPQPV